MVFGHKSKLQFDLGDFEETELLISFLKDAFKVSVTRVGNKLTFEPPYLSAQELQRVATKFIYKRNLNSCYYVSVDGSAVKINTFKGARKKQEKQKKDTLHQTAAQSWGL